MIAYGDSLHPSGHFPHESIDDAGDLPPFIAHPVKISLTRMQLLSGLSCQLRNVGHLRMQNFHVPT